MIGAAAAAAILGLSRLIGGGKGTPSASSSPGGRVPDFSGRFPVLYVEKSIPAVAPEKWTVEVGGLVEQELTIDHEQWTALPHVAYTKDFHCVEGWSVDDVDWAGVRVSEILSLAKPRPEGKFVNFLAHGGKYADDLTMAQAVHADTLLADGFEGVPLSPEHGGAVRLVIPSQLGYKNVKWVVRLEVTAERHPGYWEQRGYPVEAPIAMAQGMQRRL
ncbi:MAG TPA: molybdopterin-dependent oxidoreductase [Thermoleophilia bacterium]|nr:molybdopterin-dependent oxidoreductase [Thermoleophilia bacterium]